MIKRISDTLLNRIKSGKLRTLPKPRCKPLIDFSSNDYLGLAHNQELFKLVSAAYDVASNTQISPIFGSTGSRLLTGNNKTYVDTEAYIASFHGYPHSLISTSGWDLNFGIFSCLPSESTVVFYDELCHNSIMTGMKLGRQKCSLPFKHNDIAHLKSLLDNFRETAVEKLIAVESVYSMDGDICPIADLLQLAENYGAMVLVDEAHSTGVYGTRGEGLLSSLGLQTHTCLLGTIHTFGKAVGMHGAALLTAQPQLIPYLLNYSHPLIYSTSLPMHSLIALQQAYKMMEKMVEHRKLLRNHIQHFRRLCIAHGIGNNLLLSESPIQGVVVRGNDTVLAVAAQLRERGYECYPIRAPTVREGSERIRVVLHAHNSEEEIEGVCAALRDAITGSTAANIVMADAVSVQNSGIIRACALSA